MAETVSYHEGKKQNRRMKVPKKTQSANQLSLAEILEIETKRSGGVKVKKDRSVYPGRMMKPEETRKRQCIPLEKFPEKTGERETPASNTIAVHPTPHSHTPRKTHHNPRHHTPHTV